MARDKSGARKAAAINSDGEARLSGGDEHGLGRALASASTQSPQSGQPPVAFVQPNELPGVLNAAFAAGNIVVYRVGDVGGGGLSSAAAAVFIDEYTTAGVLVRSIALPTSDSGIQQTLTAAGTSTSEGLITLSADGHFLLLTGYDAAVATASVSGTSSATVNRVIGRISADGTVDTSTALSDFSTGSNPRGVASTNGTDIWVAGGAGGVRYTTFGATSSTQISTTFTNGRGVEIFDGQLYISSMTSTFRLSAVGTGLPTTAGQAIVNLNGIPASGTTGTPVNSPYQFFFADLTASVAGVDTVYIADDATGLLKYSLVAGTWTLNGAIGVNADDYTGLTGKVSGGTVTLYATRLNGSSADQIVSVIDTNGYNAAFSSTTPTVVAIAATNTAFRGIAFAPTAAPTDPVIDLNGAAGGIDFATSYTENNPGITIGSGITITSDSGMIHGAGIQISAGGTVGDKLVIVGGLPPGISIVSSNDTSIQFTGTASVADYQALFAAIRFLNTTEYPAQFTQHRTISVTVFDDHANSQTAHTEIDVVNVNDLPTLGGTTTGQAVENNATNASGVITISDVDFEEARVQSQSGVAGTYGSFSISEDGHWTYAPNDNNFLQGGEQVTDTFTVHSYDNSRTIDVVITVFGLNDIPLSAQFGVSGSLTEDSGSYFADGAASLFDPDHDENGWRAGTFNTAYGTFVITNTGGGGVEWTYTLNNGAAATQGVRGGQVVLDTVGLTSIDGSISYTLQIAIHGVNDAATIGGTINGNVNEDAQVTTSGTLTIADADSTENEVQAIAAGTAGANGYGTFEVAANGSWTYTLNNSLPAVQALNDGDTLTDTILVTSKDGTDTETITITIHGRTEGANTPPSVANPIPDHHSGEDAPVNYQVPANTFSDLDGDALSYFAILPDGAPLPPWLHFDSATRTFSGQPPLDFNGTIHIRVNAYDGAAFVFDEFDLIIDPAPDFPTGTDHTVTAAEDVTYTFTYADFGYADPDGDAMAGVYIHLNGGSDGLVSLNGVALTGTSNFVSIADLNAGLLTFRAPLNANGDDFATFGFQVLDTTGNIIGLDQIANVMTIDVTAVNDPLVLTVPASEITFTEGGSALTLDTGLTLVDVDGPSTISQAAVVISGGFVAGEDVLTWDTVFAATHGITGVLGDETLTFTGTASLADYQTLLRSVAYLNLNTADPNTGDREITFGAGAGGGLGQAHGVGGINNAQQPGVDHIVTVHVVGTPDFAVGTSGTVTTNEDTPYTFAYADFGYSDPDGDAMAGVYIHTNGSSDGLVYLNGVALHGASNFVSRADLDAGLLTFLPPANANGDDYATFGFQVLDATGNATGLDQTIRTMTIDVNAVNDAPDATPVGFTLAPGAYRSLNSMAFGFSDVDGNTITGITVGGGLPGTRIIYDPDGIGFGVAGIAASGFFSLSSFGDLYVTLAPDYSAYGPTYGFTFTVKDDGGTANGGVDTSGLRIMPFTVTPPNQPPVITAPAGASTDEDTSLIFSGISVADPDIGGGDFLVTLSVGHGTLTLTNFGNFSLGSGGSFAVAAANVASLLNGIRYTPDADYNGADALTITVDDQGATGSGGALHDTEVINITVNPVNDAPIINIGSIAAQTVTDTAGNDVFTNPTGTITVTDPDIGDTHSFSIVGGNLAAGIWTKSSSYGTLSLNAMTGAYSFAVNNAAVQGLVNDDQANFGITVSDGVTTDTKILSIIFDGNNDDPDLAAVGPVALVDTSADDSFADVTGTLSATDRDSGDSSTFSISGGAVSSDPNFTYQRAGTYGTLFVNTTSGAWKFVADDAAIEALKTSQSETFQLVATDTHGGIGLQTLTINVNGANDTPVLAAAPSAVYFDTVNDDVFANYDGTLVSSDRDNPETATYTLVGGVGSGLAGFDQQFTTAHGTVYVNATTGAYRFIPNDAAIEALKTTVTDSVTFTVTDSSGATSSQQFDIVINGAEDRPELTVLAGDSAGASLAETNAGLAASGTLSPADRDMDPVFLSLIAFAKSGTMAGLSASDLQLQSMLGLFPPGLFAPGAHAAAWSFNSGGEAFNYLAQGESLVLTYSVGVNDGSLQSNTQDVVITINGTNDGPVLGAIPAINYFDTPADDTFSTVNGTLAGSDADASDTLTYSISGQVADNTVSGFDHSLGTAYGRLYLNSATGAYRFVPDDAGIEALKTATSYSFTLNVADNHGASDSKLLTVNLLGVNDAPAGADKTVTGSEDDPVVFAATDFGFSDQAEGDSLLAVKITTLPGVGTLYLDSDGAGGNPPVAVTAGQFISFADINAGHLYFLGALDGFGSPYASFTFQVQDNGGTASGGVDLDPSANVMTINLTPDNLPPVVDLNGAGAGINYTASYTEDGAAIGIGSGILVSDPNSGIGDLIERMVVTLTDRVAGDNLAFTAPLPGGFSGVVTSNAGSVTITISGPGTGAQYQSILSSIVYATTNQDPTFGGADPQRTITVTVNDGTVDSAVATTTINVIAVDDAAVAQADAFTIPESGTITGGNLFANNGAGVDADPDGPALSISAVNGSGANVGTQITLASGALLTVNANGTFNYNPNHVFDSTPTSGSGASNTPAHDSFTYTLAGGSTATVTITLTGLDTNDILLGTAGADVLNGGIGADMMIGGQGNDIYIADNAGDQAIETAGQGYDVVYTSVSYTLAAGQEVEGLVALDHAATTALALTGNEFANYLLGNAGANQLNGEAGADAMEGRGGNDIYITDNTGDVVIEAAGQGYDVVYTSVSYTLAAGQEIEGLVTSDYNATTALALTGNAFANYLQGNAGGNQLNGGAGADVLEGRGGNDIYVTDNAGDLVIEAAGQGYDVVYSSVSYTLAAGQEVEGLVALDPSATTAVALTGNEIANYLIGNAGANQLSGGAGADAMEGRGGNDIYIADNIGDLAIEAAGQGYDVTYTSVSYALNDGSEIEGLVVLDVNGAAAINLTGNSLANYLIGNAGANVLNGGAGSDAIYGGGGADLFVFSSAFGAGNVDFLGDFSAADDTILLDHNVFAGLTVGALGANAFVIGTQAGDADDRIIYNQATGQLFYDADGSGTGAAVLFATLNGAPTTTFADFVVA